MMREKSNPRTAHFHRTWGATHIDGKKVRGGGSALHRLLKV